MRALSITAAAVSLALLAWSATPLRHHEVWGPALLRRVLGPPTPPLCELRSPGLVTLHRSPGFSSYAQFGAKRIRFVTREVVVDGVPWAGPGAPPERAAAFERGTRFAIDVTPIAVTSRGANEWFVVLRESEGAAARARVERWTIAPAEGAPYTERARPFAPLGTAERPAPFVVRVAGGAYRPPAERGAPVARREVLARFAFPVSAAALDATLRALVMVRADTGDVLQLDVAHPLAPPRVVATHAEIRRSFEGASRPRDPYAARDDDGVPYVLLSVGEGRRYALRDEDGDGRFEGGRVMDRYDRAWVGL